MREDKKTGFSFRRSMCGWLALVLGLGLVACGEAQEPLRAPTEDAAAATFTIETMYGTLEYPEALRANLRHMEVTEDAVAMEVFYMLGAGGEREIYRIYYADAQVGTHLGYLTTDNGEISVTYSFCEYDDEDFVDEEERKLYYSMMDAFSTVANSIHDDERFSENRAGTPVGSREVKLRYWNVTLPENVLYEETVEEDTYRVDFYCELSGERVALYYIGLGDMDAETVLGMFRADGVQKPVAVGTYDLMGYEQWPEEVQSTIHQMMESINDVIQVITSSQDFSIGNDNISES